MVLDIVRLSVFGVCAVTGLLVTGAWAVRTRRLSPFGRPARLIRKLTDPVLSSVEAQLVRRGGNPQNAEWWLLGGVAVSGIILISMLQWLGQQAVIIGSTGGRPFGLVRVITWYVLNALSVAIFIRVIGSWFGVHRFTPWAKPVYWATDWIIEPLRKVIPALRTPMGIFDVSPIVAWFGLRILSGLIA